MTTYTATAARDGAAVITDADRDEAKPQFCLRILFLVSAHNSLSQRVWTELTDRGHEVTVAVVATAEEMDTAMRDAITGLRQVGYSWADIGLRLGVSRQAAQQRWGGEPG